MQDWVVLVGGTTSVLGSGGFFVGVFLWVELWGVSWPQAKQKCGIA
jgi:hypothetical protein